MKDNVLRAALQKEVKFIEGLPYKNSYMLFLLSSYQRILKEIE